MERLRHAELEVDVKDAHIKALEHSLEIFGQDMQLLEDKNASLEKLLDRKAARITQLQGRVEALTKSKEG